MLSLLPGRDLPGTSGARVAEARRVVRAISADDLNRLTLELYCVALGRGVAESPTVRPGNPAESK
jgi:hypothetical protein